MFLDEARMSIKPLGNQKWLVNIGGGYTPDYHTSFDTQTVGVCIQSVEDDLKCELRYQLDKEKQPLDMVSAYMYYHPLKKYIHATLVEPGDFDVTIDPTEFVFDPNWNIFSKKFIGHVEVLEHPKDHARFWWKTQAFQLAHGTEFEEELVKPAWKLGDDMYHPLLPIAEYMATSMTYKDYSDKKGLAKRILDMNVLEIVDKGECEYPHYGMIARVKAGEFTRRYRLSALQK